jgi:3-oxoacyl-[acyl-carrier protein] reductase
MEDFHGKVALVTGAGRGIGRAVAQAFAGRGATVAANDISPVNLDETIGLIHAAGGMVKPYIADIAKRMPVEGMFLQVLDDFEQVDFLVICSGVEPRASVLDMDEWDWQRTLDVNLSGPFFAIQQAGRYMRERTQGSIVVMGAAAARAGGMANEAAFAASKSALLSLVCTAAVELAPFGVRVNAVCPGLVETPGELLPPSNGKQIDGKQELQQRAEASPLKRVGMPEEAADLVMYLCSRNAAHITGQAINLDGGMVMR